MALYAEITCLEQAYEEYRYECHTKGIEPKNAADWYDELWG